MQSSLNYFRSAPQQPNEGDAYFDITNGVMRIYTHRTWITVPSALGVCDHPTVWYNEHSKVVKCHRCGETAYGIMDTINVRQNDL